ncbi:MAG: oligoendopeptidase F [Gracilibacteraceae bacterium]|jgi:oligoendopeptidase F|nr:oligoendopeptidase F [Gracilibacteraceae bacterium]
MTEKLRTRAEIPAEHKWRLEEIFPDDQAWETLFADTRRLMDDVSLYEGKLADGADVLLKCLAWAEILDGNLEELYTYARMRRDEDNRVGLYQAMTDRAGSLGVDLGSCMAFFVPELMAMPEERLDELRRDDRLRLYDHYFDNILRRKEHILSLPEEKLLAEASELSEGPETIFAMANNADLKFGEIIDDQGHSVEVTKGNYTRFMERPDRRVRRDAYNMLYDTYQKQINSWAAMLTASVKSDCFFARARQYPSALAASLDSDNVPETVYDALIETVHEFLPQLHRYLDLRKRVLKLDKLSFYDLYVPIVPEQEARISYQEAVDIVREALQPLGVGYLDVLDMAFSRQWIDIYENEGKTSGAYSWGTFKSHPYVLLNHQDTLDSLFTLAHELGHALHSYYSDKTQPHIYAGYKIFVAEVASTLNESLLIRHLIQKSSDPAAKAYLLNHYLDQFRGTVFRQTMFAEFERDIHGAVEKKEALTHEGLSARYAELNTRYYGPGVEVDDKIPFEWVRIPHFYNAFYVYKYATGFSAATALAQQILEEGQPAVDRYLKFLSGGGSDYPINLLRGAGVDMERPEPVRQALSLFAAMLEELEQLTMDN